jgi:hypothetical protein
MSRSGLEILDPVTRRHVENAAEALQVEFAGIFSRETIARYIAESADKLGNSKITVFVPSSRSASHASGWSLSPRRRER